MAGSSSSSGWTNAGLCKEMQVALNRITAPYDAFGKGFITGTLDYLIDRRDSPGNRFIQNQVDSGDGKLNDLSGTNRSKGVEITYYTRQDPDSATSVEPSTGCPTGTDKLGNQTTFVVQKAVTAEVLRVNEYEVRKLCMAESDYTAMLLQNYLRAATKRLNDDINADLATQVGQWEDTSASKTFQLINTSDGSIHYRGEAQMRQQLRKNIVTGMPNLIAAGITEQYMDIAGIGGLQDTGVMTDRAGRFRFYADDDLVSNLTDTTNGGLIIEDGAVNLVTWNGFLGGYAKDFGEYQTGTIVDPETGLVWDMKMVYDNCGTDFYNNYWNITMTLNYDLFYLPSDAYSTGDSLVSTNGIWEYVASEA